MEPISHSGITVDRCTRCLGIWFDGVEHRDLKKAKGSESIDTGSAKLGREHDHMTDVNCPKCGVLMETLADTYQAHIHYEVCPQAHGVYFDAGEFRDFVKEDLGDFFKGLLATRRKKS
jgi:Zn-finger nucleic acid-binding protein